MISLIINSNDGYSCKAVNCIHFCAIYQEMYSLTSVRGIYQSTLNSFTNGFGFFHAVFWKERRSSYVELKREESFLFFPKRPFRLLSVPKDQGSVQLTHV